MKTNVRLAGRTTLPDAEALVEAGWDLEKTATPDPKDRSEKTLVEDGKKASDEPADVKVVADQREPVTSTSKEAERTIRREEIIETDGPRAEEPKKEEDEEEVAEEEENNNLHDPFHSSKVLTAMRLAEIEQELGLDSQWETGDKFARVAALEADSLDALNERIQTLQNVKQAGLSKPKQKEASTLPRSSTMKSEAREVKESNGVAPDAAIFG